MFYKKKSVKNLQGFLVGLSRAGFHSYQTSFSRQVSNRPCIYLTTREGCGAEGWLRGTESVSRRVAATAAGIACFQCPPSLAARRPPSAVRPHVRLEPRVAISLRRTRVQQESQRAVHCPTTRGRQLGNSNFEYALLPRGNQWITLPSVRRPDLLIDRKI